MPPIYRIEELPLYRCLTQAYLVCNDGLSCAEGKTYALLLIRIKGDMEKIIEGVLGQIILGQMLELFGMVCTYAQTDFALAYI